MPFLRLTDDHCELCGGPWEFVAIMTRRADTKSHGEGCDCDTNPIRAKLCASCTQKAVACAAGACRHRDCEVGAVTVQTLAEAADEGLADEAEKTGIPAHVLRFGMAYRFDPETALEVIRAIIGHGGTVDFKELRPTITFADNVHRGESSNDPGSSRTGEAKPVTYPTPIVLLPPDNHIN